jgi:hypothetical protein
MHKALTALVAVLIMIIIDLAAHAGPLEMLWLGCAWACGACTALGLEEDQPREN